MNQRVWIFCTLTSITTMANAAGDNFKANALVRTPEGNKSFECVGKHELQALENSFINITFQLPKYVYHYWCINGRQNLTMTRNSSMHFNITIRTSYQSEGTWECTFLILKKVGIEPVLIYYNEKFTFIKCFFTIDIQYSLQMTINGANVTTEQNNEYTFRRDDRIMLGCGRPTEGVNLTSGSLKWSSCRQNGACKSSKSVSSNFLEQPINFEDASHDRIIIYCVFESNAGSKHNLSVSLIHDDNFPETSTVATTKAVITTITTSTTTARLEHTETITLKPTQGTTGTQQAANKKDFTASKSVYKYGDVIEFCCRAILGTAEVKFSVTGLEHTVNMTKGDNSIFYGSYKMDFTEDIVVICDVKQNSEQKLDTIGSSSIKLKYEAPETSTYITTTPQATATSKKEKDMIPENVNLWALVGSAALLMIILLFAIVKMLTKKRPPTQSNGQYENFINEPAVTPPSFPRGAKLEETYLSPVDLIQESPYELPRNEDSTHYAQPYVSPANLYSVPVPKSQRKDTAHQDQLYSSVIPKSKRKKANDEVLYAELNLKKPMIGENKYANVQNTTYASIADADKLSSPGDESCYSNVFDGSTYANSKGKKTDYAEPSYCEVKTKNKR